MIRQAAGLRPGRALQEGLAELCRDPCNIVFVISGRGKDELQAAFGHIKGLGLAAEHGSFYRWPSNDRESGGVGVGGDGWEALHPGLMDTAWKSVARRFMQNFQAKQLQDELTDVLRFSGATSTPVEGVLFAGTTPAGTTTGVTGGGGGGGGGIDNMNICKNSGSSKTSNMSKMMTGLNVNVSTTAVTGSTRSNSLASVASEGFGAIEITHEEGLNSDTGSGGAYLEVRARGANKGNFVHMVLDRLGWPSEVSSFPAPADATDTDAPATTASSAGGRFCLCVGDDVSDEEMFVAVKSYEGVATSKGQRSVGTSASPASALLHTDGSGAEAAPASIPPVLPTGKENMTPAAEPGHHQAMQPQTHLFTVTVGSKPSDADAWLPGVSAVVSLLRILGRVTSRHGTAQRSMLAPRAAAVGISNSPMLEPHRGMTQPVSPTRSVRSASASNADDADATASGTAAKNHSFMASFADGGKAFDPIPEVSMAVRAMNVGQGMPVVRRHSYTIGGKPRISLSLAEFLQSVAQPEAEPPSF
ncbi:GT20 [Ectocarpus sp. CCAP 1310/34]|nr:GT20 [Ectocarpus sp. CCAP 1310/34]